MSERIATSADFFLWDYGSTLFPLRTTKLLVEKYAKGTLDYIQKQHVTGGAAFNSQQRVFASKRAWFLRPTVKLDPIAEFFLYDFVYRNRRIFNSRMPVNRRVFGYRILSGQPVPMLESYSQFKKAIAKYREARNHHIYFDVASYFNRIYHHDLVSWCENAGAARDDVNLFGRFLREINAGRTVDCMPQGIYPAKMIGAAFLGFLEESSRIRCSESVRLMDDVWFFDDDPKVLIDDFLAVQSLLSSRGLSVNEEKSRILQGHDQSGDVPGDLDEMKVQLLQKRREVLAYLTEYGESGEEGEEEELKELTHQEHQYLLSMLSGQNLQEEDAELVLTLMRDHSADVTEYLPQLIRDFPGLIKRIYHFCGKSPDTSEISSTVLNYLEGATQVTEFQLFWFAAMLEDYLLQTQPARDLLIALYEHENATDITKAKILEIPEKRFGLPELREEQLRTGQSGWLAWSAAVGSRVHPKSQRNHLLKYFRSASPLNQFIGQFVENAL